MGSEQKEKRLRKKIYILNATYKDNDPENLGVYDSMDAMCLGFARSIAEDRIAFFKYNQKGDMAGAVVEEKVKEIARDVALLLPSLIGNEWAACECRDGKTVYGWEMMEVEGVNDVFGCENESDNKEEEED